jgi:hypothetical protein
MRDEGRVDQRRLDEFFKESAEMTWQIHC